MTWPRRLRQPLAWYLGVTLGIPLAGGAPLEGAFVEHAVTVLAVSAAVVVAWGGLQLVPRTLRPGLGPAAARPGAAAAGGEPVEGPGSRQAR